MTSPSQDIVERLRNDASLTSEYVMTADDYIDAADTIESLRQQLEAALSASETHVDQCNRLSEQLAERDVVIKDFAQIERSMEEQLAAANDSLAIDREIQATLSKLCNNLKKQLAECQAKLEMAEAVIAGDGALITGLKNDLTESQTAAKHWEDTTHTQWESYQQLFAESQAREKVLRDALKVVERIAFTIKAANIYTPQLVQICTSALAMPSDSTALDEALRQAKREALVEAVSEWEKPYGLTDGSSFIDRLRRMTKGLK